MSIHFHPTARYHIPDSNPCSHRPDDPLHSLGAELAQSVYWLSYGLYDREIVVRLLERARELSVVQNVWTKSEAHPAPSWMGTGGQEGGVWSWHSASSSAGIKRKWRYTFLSAHMPLSSTQGQLLLLSSERFMLTALVRGEWTALSRDSIQFPTYLAVQFLKLLCNPKFK
jgi:hypothetical protein